MKGALTAFARARLGPVVDLKQRLAHRYLHDFVFIHINKTGGSSIEHALKIPFEHLTALEKRREMGEEAWGRRFSFAFVRNPWDRAVSHYEYRVVSDRFDRPSGPDGFRAWVREALGDLEKRVDRGSPRQRWVRPQARWITDEEGAVIVDFVGRFERLHEDFAEVCRRLNRKAALPHVKATRRGHYRDYYDDETRLLVARWYEEDIERFGYTF
jgi:hypothetical protein